MVKVPTALLTHLLLVVLCVLPASASAYWLGNDGQCYADESESVAQQDEDVFMSDDEDSSLAVSAVESDDDEGCSEEALDDPSSNACFEGAEYPISILPHVIAQTQAERATAALVRNALALVEVAPSLPSPDEASVEDPNIPGVPLVQQNIPPQPRRTPNACSAADPSQCEAVPWIPTIQFEVSRIVGDDTDPQFSIDPLPDAETRRGPPAPGVAAADGVHPGIDWPPRAV